MKLCAAMLTILQNERIKIQEVLEWTLRELNYHRELKARYVRTNAFWNFAPQEQKRIDVIIDNYPRAVLRYQGIIEVFDHVIYNESITNPQIKILSECKVPKIVGIAYDLQLQSSQALTSK